MELHYGEMDSPVGTLTIISDGEKVIRVDYGTFAELKDKVEKWGRRFLAHIMFSHKPEKVEHVIAELRDYFQGKRKDFTFDVAFYGTPFQQKVWYALNDIPYGETRTYKDIAQAIDNPKAVRAVGGAVNKNPFSITVPCHRVIGTNGKMIGYGGGLDKKEFLLVHEAK